MTGRGRIGAPVGNMASHQRQFADVSIATLLRMQERMVDSPALLVTVVSHVGGFAKPCENLAAAHYPIDDHGINGQFQLCEGPIRLWV